jgi:hypothetical protein
MKFNSESPLGKILRHDPIVQTAITLRGYVEEDRPHIIEQLFDKQYNNQLDIALDRIKELEREKALYQEEIYKLIRVQQELNKKNE